MLNLKLLIFIGILQVLRFDFQKFRILEILNFHPCIKHTLLLIRNGSLQNIIFTFSVNPVVLFKK